MGNDRTFKVWDIDRLVCMYESPTLGQFSLTSCAILETSDDGSVLLTLGNIDGKIVFFDISMTGGGGGGGDKESLVFSATKVGEMMLNSGKLRQMACANADATTPVAKTDTFQAVTVNSGSKSRQLRPMTRCVPLPALSEIALKNSSGV